MSDPNKQEAGGDVDLPANRRPNKKKRVAESRAPLRIGDHSFAPGERGSVNLPVGHRVTHEDVHIQVQVVRGRQPGPCLLVTAAIHGDEINGVEVVRRLCAARLLKRLRGDLIAIPVVNMPAFLARSRYLPDRRDLNRLFPGSVNGSLGARMARTLVSEVARRCDIAIDLHTGAINRPNLPQLRICNDLEETVELARAFGAPVIITAPTRSGSFRDVFARKGKPMLMFEGGEAMRLDPESVRFGLRGVLAVMRKIGMLPPDKHERKNPIKPFMANNTYWQRAPRGGVFTPLVPLGRAVTEGTTLATVSDPFSDTQIPVVCAEHGVVIGRTNQAITDEGDGLFHIAVASEARARNAENLIIRKSEELDELDERDDHPVFDDPLID